jgi:hypothetical protein
MADLDRVQHLGEVGILADGDAVRLGQLDDALGDRTASGRHHPRRAVLARLVGERHRDGMRAVGRRAGGRHGGRFP